MTSFRHKTGRTLFAALLGLGIVVPPALALHAVDVRNGRREALAAVAQTAVQRTADLCRLQRKDALSLNRVIDFFENIAKHQNPGPDTNRFWASVPRPIVPDCSMPPTKGTP